MILIDTHVVAWLAFEPAKVSATANAAMFDKRTRDEGIRISAITLMELAFLAVRNRIRLTISLESFLSDIESRFVVLPITARVCAHAMALGARFPKDPADRIIVGTALAEGLPLITADRAIIKSRAIRTIW